MSVLSEWDIINELGSGIFVYPFKGKEESIRGCELRLTASEYAYTFSVENNKNISKRLLESKGSKLNEQLIKIPARKTAIVWINESIFIREYLCGSVHSKVTLAAKGIGHLGTRVNPLWGGILAIPLQNISDIDVCIKVGETIAYLRFSKLISKSSFSQKLDNSGKLYDAIPNEFSTPSELIQWINDPDNQWRIGDKEYIWKNLKDSKGYKDAKEELKRQSMRYRFIFKRLPDWNVIAWSAVFTTVFTGILALPTMVDIVGDVFQSAFKSPK